MYYDDDYPYEPNLADEILIEYQKKMKDALLDSVKQEINILKTENEILKEKNDELKAKVRKIELKERELKEKEETLERDFYRKKFSEILKPYEDKMVAWIAEETSFLGEKCNLCDKSRKVTYTAVDGSTVKLDCKCKKYYHKKVPTKANIICLNLSKSDWYSRPKNFVVTPKYNSAEYDNTYIELRINYIFDTFDPKKVEGLEVKYGCYIGFTTEEECQKYCDWCNTQKDKDE